MMLAKQFGEFCLGNGLRVSTAESCTAGLIAATIARTAGSSVWLDSGFVVYTAAAKTKILGVRPETITDFDITSVEVAREMALGAERLTGATLTLAVTGLAGPAGGTEAIPVGTVCMCWNFSGKIYTETMLFEGERNDIREDVVRYMLERAMKFKYKMY